MYIIVIIVVINLKKIKSLLKKQYKYNNIKLIMAYIDILYETKQACYITKYTKYNIVKYI
jgi:hypothetical protein